MYTFVAISGFVPGGELFVDTQCCAPATSLSLL